MKSGNERRSANNRTLFTQIADSGNTRSDFLQHQGQLTASVEEFVDKDCGEGIADLVELGTGLSRRGRDKEALLLLHEA